MGNPTGRWGHPQGDHRQYSIQRHEEGQGVEAGAGQLKQGPGGEGEVQGGLGRCNRQRDRGGALKAWRVKVSFENLGLFAFKDEAGTVQNTATGRWAGAGAGAGRADLRPWRVAVR